MCFVSKKKLKAIIAEQTSKIEHQNDVITKLTHTTVELTSALDKMYEEFPFTLGQEVFDLQLRNSKGKYTKNNPAKNYSVVNVVVVADHNYFDLVRRYREHDVFLTYAEAEAYLAKICVE